MVTFLSRRLEALLGGSVDRLSHAQVAGLVTSGVGESFDLDFKPPCTGGPTGTSAVWRVTWQRWRIQRAGSSSWAWRRTTRPRLPRRRGWAAPMTRSAAYASCA